MTTSFLVRLYNAIVEARMRQAMRELALHRHLVPGQRFQPVDVVPKNEVERAGNRATYTDAGMLPFVR